MPKKPPDELSDLIGKNIIPGTVATEIGAQLSLASLALLHAGGYMEPPR